MRDVIKDRLALKFRVLNRFALDICNAAERHMIGNESSNDNDAMQYGWGPVGAFLGTGVD